MYGRVFERIQQFSSDTIKFRGIFCGQIHGKIGRIRVTFAGVFGANFTKKQSVKNSRFCGYFKGKFR